MRIYLVGFMGSGKTKNGKILAAKTGMQFIDLDDLITQHENKSIAEIFAANGEDYFRTLETQILLSTQSFENAIISCGEEHLVLIIICNGFWKMEIVFI